MNKYDKKDVIVIGGEHDGKILKQMNTYCGKLLVSVPDYKQDEKLIDGKIILRYDKSTSNQNTV